MYKIKIVTLNGKTCFFETEPLFKKNIDINEFNKYIYKHHPYLDKPFSIKDIDKLELELRHNGVKLEGHILLTSLSISEDDTFVFCVKTKSQDITHKSKRSLIENYKISPYSKEKYGDIFMDTFEFNDTHHENEKIQLIKTKIENIKNELNSVINLVNEI